jgi:hypothetical protein
MSLDNITVHGRDRKGCGYWWTEMEIGIRRKTTMTEMVNDDDETSASMIHLLVCFEFYSIL